MAYCQISVPKEPSTFAVLLASFSFRSLSFKTATGALTGALTIVVGLPKLKPPEAFATGASCLVWSGPTKLSNEFGNEQRCFPPDRALSAKCNMRAPEF
mgnify:CR=1 FL=1